MLEAKHVMLYLEMVLMQCTDPCGKKFWSKGKLSVLYPNDILMYEGIGDKCISCHENDGQKIM